MNNHAGWTNEGRCVLCAAKEATGQCDPYARIIELESLLEESRFDLTVERKLFRQARNDAIDACALEVERCQGRFSVLGDHLRKLKR